MRKLRDESTNAVLEKPKELEIPNEKLFRNSKAENELTFDFSTLDHFLPYRKDEDLSPPIIKKNSKGIHYLLTAGEPRFYFQGNEFIKVYRGLGGKKTVLFWTYKGDSPHEIKSEISNDIRPLHRRMRAYLRKRGIPGA